MATHKGHDLVSRAVREALCTFVSPPLCEQLITRSLASQGLSEIPESGLIIGEWLEGPLRDQVEAAVGPDAADLLLMQLGPIAAHAAIAASPLQQGRHHALPAAPPIPPSAPNNDAVPPVQGAAAASDPVLQALVTEPLPGPASSSSPEPSDRPTGIFDAPTSAAHGIPSRPPSLQTLRERTRTAAPTVPSLEPEPLAYASGEGRRPAARVLAATRSEKVTTVLATRLAPNARVDRVPDLVGLLDALEEPSGIKPVVLVDCLNPTVHVSSIAAIGEDLPAGTTVVLWGADDQTWNDIDRERTPVCRWVRCSKETGLEDIGSLCVMLLG